VVANSVGAITQGATPCAMRMASRGFTDSSYVPSGVRISNVGTPEGYQFAAATVTSMLYLSDLTQLWVAGIFDTAGDVPAFGIATYTFSSTTCSAGYFSGTWADVQGGVNDLIHTMKRIDNYVYVGGDFTRVGLNLFANHIAAFNLLTQSWETLNAGLDGTVRRLISFQGQLLAAGDFATGSGLQLPGLALWDGERWSALPVNSLVGTCNAGCSAPCVSTTCSPNLASITDVRVVGSELLILGMSTTNQGQVWRYDAGAGRQGYRQANEAGPFTQFSVSPSAHQIAIGEVPNEYVFWNLHAGDLYNQYGSAVYDMNKHNFIYDYIGFGTNGVVYNNQPAEGAAVIAAVSSFLLLSVLMLLSLAL